MVSERQGCFTMVTIILGYMLTKDNNCKVAHKFCNTSQQRGLLGGACIEMKDKV